MYPRLLRLAAGPVRHHHRPRHHHPATPPPAPEPSPSMANPIPQGNGGDQDAGNNGGPSGGDASI